MTKERKLLVFDMDGTIVDLYGVENWLPMLRAEDTTPYEIANPIYDMVLLNTLLLMLKSQGWEIAVTTWLAKGSTDDYNRRTEKAKKTWLDVREFPYDYFFAVPYGYDKSLCTKNLGGVQWIIDDDKKVRDTWTNGFTFNANLNVENFLGKMICETW